MKKLLLILLSGLMLFSFAGCESDDDSQELSKVESELADIEEVLGKVANDYLNADITKSEAEEKLDMLESRVKNIENEAKDEATIYTGDDIYKKNAALTEEEHFLSVRVDIGSFKGDLFTGDVDDITELRDEHYKK